jgi:hypothetical protein
MKTKEIRLNGKKYVLTLEEIHKINLIRRGLRLQERMDPLKNELKEIKDELSGLAVERKGGGRLVRLDGIIVEAVVTWKKDIALDPEKTAELRAKLGEKEFGLFFEERTDYKPTKELNLLTKTKDHKEDAKKLAIINALTIKETGPYVELKHKNTIR